jgi:hypothetical protein
MTLTIRIGAAKPVSAGGVQACFLLTMEAVVVSDASGPGHSCIFVHRRGDASTPDQFMDLASAAQLKLFPASADALRPGEYYLHNKVHLALLSLAEYDDVKTALLRRAKVLTDEWKLMNSALLTTEEVQVDAYEDTPAQISPAQRPAIAVFTEDGSKVQYVDASGTVIGEVNLLQA